MTTQAETLLNTVARELHISDEELLRQGLQVFLQHQLRSVKADIFEICSRYGVTRVEEMEARYKSGALEEADSWRDLQRLDHLEHKRDRLASILKNTQ